MTTGEKILLILSGVFTVASLLLLLYLPGNTLFVLGILPRVLLNAAVGVFFLLFIKFRQSMKLSLIFFWILLVLFLISTVLFALAMMTAIPRA